MLATIQTKVASYQFKMVGRCANNGTRYAWTDAYVWPFTLLREEGAFDGYPVTVKVPSTDDVVNPAVTDFVHDQEASGDGAKVTGGVDWSTQPKQTTMGFDFVIPVSWAKYFSYPGGLLLSLEYYAAIPASYVESDPDFSIDVGAWLTGAWVGKPVFSQTNTYFTFKALVAGAYRFAGVAPVIKVWTRFGASSSLDDYTVQCSLEVKGYYSGTFIASIGPTPSRLECDSDPSSPPSSFVDLGEEEAEQTVI